jgi:hypothetical protein
MSDVGIDPDRSEPGIPQWRLAFVRAFENVSSPSFVTAFPTFRLQQTSRWGLEHRFVRIRGDVPGVSFANVPGNEIFPPLPVPSPIPDWWLFAPGTEWLRRCNQWALDRDFAAAIPTGVTTTGAGGILSVGLVLFLDTAVELVDVPGPELFLEEACAVANPHPVSPTCPTRPSGFFQIVDEVLIGTATSAAPMDQSPFGTPRAAPAESINHLRCMATLKPITVLLCPPTAGDDAVITMTGRKDSRTLVYFSNWGAHGAWLVAHAMDPTSGASTGEVASSYLPEFSSEVFAFELTPGSTAAPGAIVAESIGIVKQGFAGVAVQVMSFTWGTWLAMSRGMNVAVRWQGR